MEEEDNVEEVPETEEAPAEPSEEPVEDSEAVPDEKNPDSHDPRRLRQEIVSGERLKIFAAVDEADEDEEKDDNSIAESSCVTQHPPPYNLLNN